MTLIFHTNSRRHGMANLIHTVINIFFDRLDQCVRVEEKVLGLIESTTTERARWLLLIHPRQVFETCCRPAMNMIISRL